MAATRRTGPTKEAFLPWAGSSSLEPEYEESTNWHPMVTDFVTVTVILHGTRRTRERCLDVPIKMTCADFKGHLAVEGVVPSCGGLEVALEEDGTPLDEAAEMFLEHGQVLHLTRAADLVSVTALATGGVTATGAARTDEEVYELVLPSELTGIALREQIEMVTAGVLRPAAVFVAEDEQAAHAVGDEEVVCLTNEQAIIVHRAEQFELTTVQAAANPPAADIAITQASSASLVAKLTRMLGMRTGVRTGTGKPKEVCIMCASNVKVKGSTLTCTTKSAWAGCVVFDVPDSSFFELGVRLLADAPTVEAEGLAGRWMLGVIPAAAAATKTEKERWDILNKGHFVTVCHGHPAKLHAPSMAKGTCGEDCPAVPGDLRKDQVLTLRWSVACGVGTLTVQVDDDYPVALPYTPDPSQEVRPCLIFGGKPAEVSVVQLAKKSSFAGA
eukprot:gnl/TRDRNA2_/TRDRNA2_188049_c0_seq1.p1 gnl/TRDRNA2_/TRDRNA2_188049_c0~~gnl/TRDRNA2_/TRDRNA2_188049_c0_seq1.p1  ORF type:complete len:443 (+),score=89.91 gnl/TRDRNA2_/TRDRNA2_188049_c0_seq1:65-1393(+)